METKCFMSLQVIDINVYGVNGRGFHSPGILRPSLYFLAMLGDTEFFDAKIGASSALHIVVLSIQKRLVFLIPSILYTC